MKNYKLKIGQKYKVIKDCVDSSYNGKIITVKKVIGVGFYDKKGDWYDPSIDKLQLISPKTPKTKSKWKYSREEMSKVFKNGYSINKAEKVDNMLLAKEDKPVKDIEKSIRKEHHRLFKNQSKEFKKIFNKSKEDKPVEEQHFKKEVKVPEKIDLNSAYFDMLTNEEQHCINDIVYKINELRDYLKDIEK
jgi:hypothetical protein